MRVEHANHSAILADLVSRVVAQHSPLLRLADGNQIITPNFQRHLDQVMPDTVLLGQHHGAFVVGQDILDNPLAAFPLAVTKSTLHLAIHMQALAGAGLAGLLVRPTLERDIVRVSAFPSIHHVLRDNPRIQQGMLGHLGNLAKLICQRLQFSRCSSQYVVGVSRGHAGTTVRLLRIDLGNLVVTLLSMLRMQEQGHIIHRETSSLNLLDQRFNQLGAEVLNLVCKARVHPFLSLIDIGLFG